MTDFPRLREAVAWLDTVPLTDEDHALLTGEGS